MKMNFKDFNINATDLRELAKCICDQITVPDDIPAGTRRRLSMSWKQPVFCNQQHQHYPMIW